MARDRRGGLTIAGARRAVGRGLAQAFAAPGGPGPDVTCVEEATSVTEGERVVCGVHAPGMVPALQH